MEEPAAAPEPEPEPEQEPTVEEVKLEGDEKVVEETEEKAPSPTPVESPPNPQEPPKVDCCYFCVCLIYLRGSDGSKKTTLWRSSLGCLQLTQAHSVT